VGGVGRGGGGRIPYRSRRMLEYAVS